MGLGVGERAGAVTAVFLKGRFLVNVPYSARAGIAALAFLSVTPSGGPASAHQSARTAGNLGSRFALSRTAVSHSPEGRMQELAHRRRLTGTPEPCSADATAAPAPQYFVGIPAVNPPDIAGGDDSAVLGGTANAACATDAGIGSGTGNAVYGQGGSSFVAGGIDNTVAGPVGGSMVGAGALNVISGAGSFIGAGDIAYVFSNGLASANQISGDDSFIGAGDLNAVAGSGSFIGAGGFAYAEGGSPQTGLSNSVSGNDSFVGAGNQNTVVGNESFIGSGNQNTAAATEAFLGGGYLNTIGASATFSSIAGGNSNAASNAYETIGGGFENVAKGADATIPGGQRNEAYGELSFAAGYQAHALSAGSFVWSDFRAGSTPLADTAANQFVVRASGGTYVYSNESDTAGVKLAAGSGAWSNLSDRNAKTDVVPLDDDGILAKVGALPVSSWRYISESGVRHVGPMAQDFYAAFGVGEDDRHITSIDEDGIALAAIKALRLENARLERRLDELEARLPRSLSRHDEVRDEPE